MKSLVLLVALVGCGGDLDPPWQLDHDRIIAIRATPPAILAGETAEIDGLIAVKGNPTQERPPDLAGVVRPSSLASFFTMSGGKWVVTGPTEDALVAARVELKLPEGAPVPLEIGVCFAGAAACVDQSNTTMIGIKTITLGVAASNPTMPSSQIDDAPAPAPSTEIVVDALAEVPLHVDSGDTDDVNWLTSCGTLHDDDLPTARISFEKDDPTEGELVLVLRNDKGGVTWQVWPIRGE